MTKDEIYKITKQADKEFDGDREASEWVEYFAKLVAEKSASVEREACAKLVDDNAKACTNNSMAQMVLYSNAAAIRARGEA